MTTPADDFAVEDAFEACLAGRPVPDEAAGLAAFTAAVRSTATSPGRPSAALAELLVIGRPADQPSPSIETARTRRRRRSMILPVLIAKFLSAGAVAQAATGAGVALVVVAGAGTVGALPGPVQDTFSSIVGTETVADETDPADTTPEDVDDEVALDEPTENLVEEPVDAEEPVDPAVFDAAEWAIEGPAESQSFGEWVREAARHGGVDGQIVRGWAQRKGMQEADLEAEGVDLDALTDVATEPAPEVEETTDAATAPIQERPGNRGNGNGGGTASGGPAGGPANGNGGGRGNGNGGGRGNGRN